MSHRSLRFCMITTFFPPHNFGGDGIFVQRLSNELARQGHHVEVIHCVDAYRSLSHGEPKSAEAEQSHITVHALQSSFGFLSPLLTQQTGRPLLKSAQIRKILARGFDVIHYPNTSLVGGPAILSYGNAIKLYTMHEYWLVCPTHILLKFGREPCLERNCLPCTLAHRRPPQWWRYTNLLRKSAKHVDAFIAPSRFSKRLHDAALGVESVYLPNFVPVSEPGATPEKNGDADRKPYFLFVGRLEMLKGPQTLIPLFRNFSNAQLWIAGAGNYERQLRELAGVSENIRFLGHQTEHELKTLYRNALGVIVPSLFYEVFPLVTIEAFRQRTPIIVKNIGGLPEIVEDSGGGFVYDSEEQLKNAIDRLISEPSLRLELGARGYQHYQSNWTPDAHFARYFELIDKIASRRGSLQQPGSMESGQRQGA